MKCFCFSISRQSSSSVGIPRRIAEIRLDFYLPGDYSDKDKKILQGAAETCPVGKSLHPDIRQAVTWHYGSAK